MITANPTLAEFKEAIGRQAEDESNAYVEYQTLARAADGLGYHEVASTLRSISEDEKRHHSLLNHISEQLSSPREHNSEVAQLGRQFPQTYDDYANLGIDVYRAKPDLAEEVHKCLVSIYSEAQAPTTADAAKRWMVRKAGELGIG